MTDNAIIRTRFMSGLLAGLLIAAAASAGIYAVAAAAASTLAASFATTETTGETRLVVETLSAETRLAGIATRTKRAMAEHRAARAKCERLAGTDRYVCRSEARAAMKRAVHGVAGM